MDDLLFRKAMGKFATGITVVTFKSDGELKGITVNAFMSVSLNPKLILISIDENSSSYPKILNASRFGVSILREDQKDISMIFAKQKKADREIEYVDIDGIPVIKDSLAMLSCRVQDKVKAGDHMLFIAEVTGLQVNEGEPILYFGSQYRQLK